MTKIKDFIEKIWWVIPLIIVVSMPQFLTEAFPGSRIDTILRLFPLGFLGFGYYLVRKNPSLFLRIFIPTILYCVGHAIGFVLAIIIGIFLFGGSLQ